MGKPAFCTYAFLFLWLDNHTVGINKFMNHNISIKALDCTSKKELGQSVTHEKLNEKKNFFFFFGETAIVVGRNLREKKSK